MQHLALLSKFRARSSNNPLIYHASSLIALECLALLETLLFSRQKIQFDLFEHSFESAIFVFLFTQKIHEISNIKSNNRIKCPKHPEFECCHVLLRTWWDLEIEGRGMGGGKLTLSWVLSWCLLFWRRSWSFFFGKISALSKDFFLYQWYMQCNTSVG